MPTVQIKKTETPTKTISGPINKINVPVRTVTVRTPEEAKRRDAECLESILQKFRPLTYNEFTQLKPGDVVGMWVPYRGGKPIKFSGAPSGEDSPWRHVAYAGRDKKHPRTEARFVDCTVSLNWRRLWVPLQERSEIHTSTDYDS
jgi:hypothetical protein